MIYKIIDIARIDLLMQVCNLCNFKNYSVQVYKLLKLNLFEILLSNWKHYFRDLTLALN